MSTYITTHKIINVKAYLTPLENDNCIILQLKDDKEQLIELSIFSSLDVDIRDMLMNALVNIKEY